MEVEGWQQPAFPARQAPGGQVKKKGKKMILITEKTRVENAIAKARNLKPRVFVQGFSCFTVQGSKGDLYTVSFEKKELGLFGLCSCPAGLNRFTPCYHLAACYPIFKLQVKTRAALRRPGETDEYPCFSCGQLLKLFWFDEENLCPFCSGQALINEETAAQVAPEPGEYDPCPCDLDEEEEVYLMELDF